jgi:radical SAM protein with 4Fe4S-binding SPASM domain
MSQYFEIIPAQKAILCNSGSMPFRHLDLELTERCNNNCIHCCVNLPADDESARSREYPSGEIKRILREAADLGFLTVRFTGGEPLLRDDFEELYLYARRLGLKVLLATNARLINEPIADLFVRSPPLEEIDVSVYGMNAKSYEAVTRVEGSYAQFRSGINLLLKRNIPFVVSGTLLPSNRFEMEAFESWASTIPWMTAPPMYALYLDLRKRRDSFEKNHRIQQLRISPCDALAILNRRPARERRSWMVSCRRRMKPAGDKLFHCSAPRGGCVDAYGRYQACMSLCAPEWTYNLQEGTLREAIEYLDSRIRNARAENPEYLKRCASCFIRPLCDQCPAKSWIEYGSLDRPVEYLCTAAHLQAHDWGLIHGEEKAWDVRDWQDRAAKLSLQVDTEGVKTNGEKEKMVYT